MSLQRRSGWRSAQIVFRIESKQGVVFFDSTPGRVASGPNQIALFVGQLLWRAQVIAVIPIGLECAERGLFLTQCSGAWHAAFRHVIQWVQLQFVGWERLQGF